MKKGEFFKFLSSLVVVEFFSLSLAFGFVRLMDCSDEPDDPLVANEFFSFSLSAGFLGLIDSSDESDEPPHTVMAGSFSLPLSPLVGSSVCLDLKLPDRNKGCDTKDYVLRVILFLN